MMMESEIIRKIIHGDTDEFRYFIDRYKDMAFSIAISMIPDEPIAEDVVQDAFIKAFKNLKQFRRKAKFSTWFYAIVVNEARIQKRKRKLSVLSLDSDFFNGSEPFEDNQALHNLHAEDQKRVINGALSNLSDRESLLLRLFYLNENSIREIHKITGFSVSSIKTGLHRARKSFNRVLKMTLKDEAANLVCYREQSNE